MTTATRLIPTARVTSDADGWSVTVDWASSDGTVIDRPNVGGWGFGPKHQRLAERLAAAINAGVVFGTPELRTDINGKTFVNAPSKVLGRTANADLKRLGF